MFLKIFKKIYYYFLAILNILYFFFELILIVFDLKDKERESKIFFYLKEDLDTQYQSLII